MCIRDRPKPIKTTEVAIQSVRESIAVALRADEEIFFDCSDFGLPISDIAVLTPPR